MLILIATILILLGFFVGPFFHREEKITKFAVSIFGWLGAVALTMGILLPFVSIGALPYSALDPGSPLMTVIGGFWGAMILLAHLLFGLGERLDR